MFFMSSMISGGIVSFFASSATPPGTVGKPSGEAEFSNSVKEPKKLDSSNNIGSKMLERMGWKEGLGLGKANQGRTSIIEAEGNRNSSAGLGATGAAAVKANPNESYKDSVKRTLFSRYHNIE